MTSDLTVDGLIKLLQEHSAAGRGDCKIVIPAVGVQVTETAKDIVDMFPTQLVSGSTDGSKVHIYVWTAKMNKEAQDLRAINDDFVARWR